MSELTENKGVFAELSSMTKCMEEIVGKTNSQSLSLMNITKIMKEIMTTIDAFEAKKSDSIQQELTTMEEWNKNIGDKLLELQDLLASAQVDCQSKHLAAILRTVTGIIETSSLLASEMAITEKETDNSQVFDLIAVEMALLAQNSAETSSQINNILTLVEENTSPGTLDMHKCRMIVEPQPIFHFS